MKMNSMTMRVAFNLTLVFGAFLLLCDIATSQNDQVKGVINGRNGSTMTVTDSRFGNVTVSPHGLPRRYWNQKESFARSTSP